MLAKTDNGTLYLFDKTEGESATHTRISLSAEPAPPITVVGKPALIYLILIM